MKTRKILKYILFVIIGLFILLNIIAYSHAYRFTHFQADRQQDTTIIEKRFFKKAEMLLTFLVNFMGSGGSEGEQTTIGYFEAENVKSAYDYIKEQSKDEKIILMGTSMGAAAILKAENDHGLKADALILECPYGTMLETVSARFDLVGIPAFPMANILAFWGGIQNNFNAFTLNPTEYAKKVEIPTLLIYGEKDTKVRRGEIDRIFNNLGGNKELKTYPLATHADYLDLYKDEWRNDTKSFLLKHLQNRY